MTPLPPSVTGSPRVIAFVLGTIAILQAHTAFSDSLNTQAALLAILLLAVGCAFSHLVWELRPQLLATPRRELLAVSLVIAALVVILIANAERPIEQLEGWQWAIIALSLLATSLHSQPSYMLFLAAYASLALQALSLRPSVFWGVALFAAILALLTALAQREGADRFPEEGRAFRTRPPAAHAARAMLVLLVAFGALYVNKPAARGATAKEWLEWFREGKGRTKKGGVIPGKPGAGAPNPQGVPGAAGQAGVEDPSAPGPGSKQVTFGRDLKFGAGSSRSMRIAMFVHVRGVDDELLGPITFKPYWAASAVSDYDGRVWKGDETPPLELKATNRDPMIAIGDQTNTEGTLIEQRYVLMPFADRSLFAIYPVKGVGLPSVGIDLEGRLRRTTRHSGRFRYRVRSRYRRPTITRLRSLPARHSDSRYTQVPESVRTNPRFKRILETVRYAGPAAYDRILGVLQLLQTFTYTLNPDLDPEADPTLAFLEVKRGYCQHFASAMALLLRATNIPTRIGIGFAGGEWKEAGRYYVVRRGNAHSWVEVHFEGYGWVIFDPSGVSTSEVRDLETRRRRDRPTSIPRSDPQDSDSDDPRNPDPTPTPTPTESAETDPNPTDPPPVEPTPTARPIPRPTPRPTARPSPGVATPRPPRPQRRPPNAAPLTGPTGPIKRRPSPFEVMWTHTNNKPASNAPSAAGGPQRGGGSNQGNRGGGLGSTTTGSTKTKPPNAAAQFLASSLFRDGLAAALLAALAFIVFLIWRAWPASEEGEDAEDIEQGAALGALTPIPELRRRPTHREVEVVVLYLKLLTACRHKGLGREPAETPLEFARRHSGRIPDVGRLTHLFERARYGPVPLLDPDVAQARQLVSSAIDSL